MIIIRCQITQGKVKIVTIFGVRKDSSFMQGKCNGSRLGLRQQSLVNSFTYYLWSNIRVKFWFKSEQDFVRCGSFKSGFLSL